MTSCPVACPSNCFFLRTTIYIINKLPPFVAHLNWMGLLFRHSWIYCLYLILTFYCSNRCNFCVIWGEFKSLCPPSTLLNKSNMIWWFAPTESRCWKNEMLVSWKWFLKVLELALWWALSVVNTVSKSSRTNQSIHLIFLTHLFCYCWLYFIYSVVWNTQAKCRYLIDSTLFPCVWVHEQASVDKKGSNLGRLIMQNDDLLISLSF